MMAFWILFVAFLILFVAHLRTQKALSQTLDVLRRVNEERR